MLWRVFPPLYAVYGGYRLAAMPNWFERLWNYKGKSRNLMNRFRGCRRDLTPVFRYNPVTAADEKIPLSMVHVNTKPQYLVFCLLLRHLDSKYGQFACGELTAAPQSAGSHVPDAAKTMQSHGLATRVASRVSWLAARAPHRPPLYTSSLERARLHRLLKKAPCLKLCIRARVYSCRKCFPFNVGL